MKKSEENKGTCTCSREPTKIGIIKAGNKKADKSVRKRAKKKGENDSGGGGGYLFHYNPKTKNPDLGHDITGREVTRGKRSV